MQSYIRFKDEAITLRRRGKTYTEIQELLGVVVPPSTLCTWFRQLQLSRKEKELILFHRKEKARNGNSKASAMRKLLKEHRLKDIYASNLYLKKVLDNKDAAKVGLALLYLGEGSKNTHGSLCLGNSNPDIIRLFLRLLRKCYAIEEEKFRCTIQHRADQDAETLKLFWSDVTHIPLTQFYDYKPDIKNYRLPD